MNERKPALRKFPSTQSGGALLDTLERFREWSADPNVKQVLMDMDLCIVAIEDEAAKNVQTLCPAGCGCRLETEDADRADCGCDGPCCWYDWDQFMDDVMDRPEYYRELREART